LPGRLGKRLPQLYEALAGTTKERGETNAFFFLFAAGMVEASACADLGTRYTVTPLVSNQAGVAPIQDSHLPQRFEIDLLGALPVLARGEPAFRAP